MRIITGSKRGKKLITLEGEQVRPTTDRVKESLFNILQFQLEGRRFLDLFAGSGQIGLEALQQGCLLCVVFIGVHRADDLVLVQHRRGGAGPEGPAAEVAAEGVIAQQSLDDLRIKAVFSHGAAGLTGVVKDPSGVVGDQDPAQARLLHHRHGGGHVLLVQLVQPRQRVHHHGHAALQGGLLGPEHQILGHQQRVGVQQDQHRRDDEDVAEAEFELQAAYDPASIL